MFTITNLLLVLAVITTALMAGLFYTWACSVTIGLGSLPDAEYIAAMQAINRAILNPLFFAGFFGAALFLPITTYLHYSSATSPRFWFLLAATLLYLVGVLGITLIGNVPLNETLDRFSLTAATAQKISTQRFAFEQPWNKLNLLRAVAGILALVMVVLACICSPAD